MIIRLREKLIYMQRESVDFWIIYEMKVEKIKFKLIGNFLTELKRKLRWMIVTKYWGTWYKFWSQRVVYRV